MRRYDRHVALLLVQAYGLVTVMLATLAGFIELVQQLDEVGEHGYGLMQALGYVALATPRRVLDLAPIVALVGTLIPVALLADAHELVALRALGVRFRRIAWSVLQPGIALALLAAIAGQYVAPRLEQRALKLRATALAEDVMTDTAHGVWSRAGNTFVNVEQVRRGRIPVGVDIYEFDDAGNLVRFRHGDWAQVESEHQWMLHGVVEKTVEHGRFRTTRTPAQLWDASLDARALRVLLLPPEALAPLDLWRYIAALRARVQRVPRLELLLWQQIAQPLTTLAMVLLAIPLVLTIPRGSGLARAILLGVIVGVAYYFAGQSLGYLGIVLSLPAPLTALVPPLLALTAGLLLLRRQR